MADTIKEFSQMASYKCALPQMGFETWRKHINRLAQTKLEDALAEVVTVFADYEAFASRVHTPPLPAGFRAQLGNMVVQSLETLQPGILSMAIPPIAGQLIKACNKDDPSDKALAQRATKILLRRLEFAQRQGHQSVMKAIMDQGIISALQPSSNRGPARR